MRSVCVRRGRVCRPSRTVWIRSMRDSISSGRRWRRSWTIERRRFMVRIIIHWSGFRAGDGGPGLIVWALYSLLERFLKRGPAMPRHPPLRRGVYDHATCRMHNFLKLHRDYCTLYALPPALVADYLSAHINGLLSMSCHKAEYLYERIGCIRVRPDGEVRKGWDLARCLAGGGWRIVLMDGGWIIPGGGRCRLRSERGGR